MKIRYAIGAVLCLAAIRYLDAQVVLGGSGTVQGAVGIGVAAQTAPPCTITGPSSQPNGQVGVMYTGTALTTSNCTAPLTYTVISRGIPGITISSTTGQPTGTPAPNSQGTYNLVIGAVDSSTPKQPASIQYTIIIAPGVPPPPPCQINTNTEPQAQVSVAYTGNVLSTSNCASPLSFAVTVNALPNGLTITSSNGQVTGTPLGPTGTFPFTVQVTDNNGATATVNLSIVVVAAPPPPCKILTTSEPNGTAGVSYTGATIQTQNCTAPITYSLASGSNPLPAWATLNTSTGVVSGSNPTVGTTTFLLEATDSSSPAQTPTQPLTIAIANVVSGGGHNEYCNSSGVWTGPASDGDGVVTASAPSSCMYTARAATPSPGSTVTVCPSGCTYTTLAAAEAGISCGQTVQIKSTTTGTPSGTQLVYGPALTTLAHNCDNAHWITIETDQMAGLPAEGTRITPGWVGVSSLAVPCSFALSGNCGRPQYTQPSVAGVYMPKLLGTPGTFETIKITGSYYRLIGLQVTSASGAASYELIGTTGGANHLIFDQLLLNGGNSPTFSDTQQTQCGFCMNTATAYAVIDSTILDIKCLTSQQCVDSQGIQTGGNDATVDGAPCKVVDNFIESSGEGIFSGGGGLGTSTQPMTDCEVRLNHLFKPLMWMNKAANSSYNGAGFIIKNAFEMKNAQRVWVEGNIFEQTWSGQSDQFGYLVLLTPKNQAAITATGSANIDAAGNVTWVSGTQFNSNMVSPNCATPNHCLIKLPESTTTYKCQVASLISSTQITVNNCTPGNPPAANSIAFTAWAPGLNPNAINTDIVLRDNYLLSAARGVSIATAVSDALDLGKGSHNVVVENNVYDDILADFYDVGRTGCCEWGSLHEITNDNNTPTNSHNIAVYHNTGIAQLSTGGASNSPPDFGFSNGAAGGGGPITNLRLHDNVMDSGWIGMNPTLATALQAFQALDSLNGVAQNTYCFDHNLLATVYENNPPYPGTSDSPGCGFTRAGQTLASTWAAVKFSNFSNGYCGSYSLLSGSPGHNAASDGTDIGVNWATLQTAIAGVGPMLCPSAPSGTIWQPITGPSNATYIHDVATDASGNIYLADAQGTGLWKSTNGGSSWSQINNGITGTACTGHPNGTLCAWTITYDSTNNQLTAGFCANCDHTASKNASMFRSTNGGASWTAITLPAALTNGITNAASVTGPAVNPSTGFAVWGGHWDSTGLNGTIWSSDGFATTNTGTFTAVACSSPAQGAYGYLYNPISHDYWLGTEDCGVYRSTDGKAWTEVSPAVCPFGTPCMSSNFGDLEWFTYDNSGNVIVMSNNLSVFRSSPGSGGQYNWTKIASGGFNDGGLLRDPVHGYFYVGQSANTGDKLTAIMRSIDQGVTWLPYTSGIPTNTCGTNYQAKHIVYNSSDGHLYAAVYYGSCANPNNIYGFLFKTVNPI